MKQSISEEFDERFQWYLVMTDGDIELYKPRKAIKSFIQSKISQAIAKERKELREKIEDMIMQQKYEEDFPESNTPRSETEEWRRKMYGYNQAINQVLSLLEEK